LNSRPDEAGYVKFQKAHHELAFTGTPVGEGEIIVEDKVGNYRGFNAKKCRYVVSQASEFGQEPEEALIDDNAAYAHDAKFYESLEFTGSGHQAKDVPQVIYLLLGSQLALPGTPVFKNIRDLDHALESASQHYLQAYLIPDWFQPSLSDILPSEHEET